jgi:hypothetical protein
MPRKNDHHPDEYIVKVQVPLFASRGGGRDVMVYNETRTIQEMLGMDQPSFDDLIDWMRGEPKAFFYAYSDKETKMLVLLRPAEWQEW